MTQETDPAWTFAYNMEGGTHEHDPRDRPRPDGKVRPVGYLEIGPNTPTSLMPKWHRLGPAVRPADELMHRFYLASMQQLVTSDRILGGKAFYPDEAGILVAVCLLRAPEPRQCLLHWRGYDVRAVYVAGLLGLGAAPDAVLPEGIR